MSGREIRDYTIETVGNRGALLNRLWSLGPATMRDRLGGFRFGHFNLEMILGAFLPAEIPQDFSHLRIPLKISATDYYGQAEAILEQGDLRVAIAASAAIPGLSCRSGSMAASWSMAAYSIRFPMSSFSI